VYSTAWRIESDQDLFQHYFDVQANIHNPITRSAQEPSVEYQAFVAYESQNWPLAQSLLDSAMSVDNRPEYALYLANVYMVQRRFDQALPLLEHYLESGDMYSDRALWFLALSHLALDQKDRSIEYLNEMVRLQSYPHEQAAELLSKLK
jgi:tetratricopeptide (TPR) repeat protein